MDQRLTFYAFYANNIMQMFTFFTRCKFTFYVFYQHPKAKALYMILVPKRLIEQKCLKSSLKDVDRWKLSNVNWQTVPQLRSGNRK